MTFEFLLCVYVHVNISLRDSKVTTPCFSKIMRYDLAFHLIRGFQDFVEYKKDLHRISSRVIRLKIKLLFVWNAAA